MSGTATQRGSLHMRSAAYIDAVETWLGNRPSMSLKTIIADAGSAGEVAIVSVDLIVGFCHRGPLASPRVNGILPTIRDLLSLAHASGVTSIVLTQDSHRPDAEEFTSYPPHCIAGTEESETVPELTDLPFSESFTIVPKNSISSIIEPGFIEWEAAKGPFNTYIVVGDCTDLCVYQAAMGLKLRSVQQHLGHRVIVPSNGVETYDISVEMAETIGSQPHDGDLLHHVFLHSMAQNGVEVVGSIV